MVAANPEWMKYQQDVSRFFGELGMEALVDQTVRGVRTSHGIDVLVRGSYVGFDITWVVECKAWRSRIPKEKVLALRQIVDDIGADRGFIMAESGYQSGALEAALVSNVTLTSIGDLTERLRYDLAMTKLAKLEHRADEAREQYWALGKYVRIEAGLRPDVGEAGYSGTRVISGVEQVLREVRLRGFPVIYNPEMATFASYGGPYSSNLDRQAATFDNPEELFSFLDGELSELEAKLERTHRGGSALPASEGP
ncbi:Restriction endonuclease [Mycobacteroides abscessus subsp. abscessus]|nr:Restriction endonuclease [Mycobacteroides abscessus subsp. abscessus]SLK73901.1 Restriction endonuclease [Mycobacteroides abscessus subsp. abscessus]